MGFSITDIKGVIPAMITTFNKDEKVDLGRAEKLTEFLIGEGVNGLYITGSTGEGFLMTGEERKAYAERVVKTAAGRVPVIVHVGDIGTRKSVELAEHAESIGADAISSVPPFYYHFSADDIYSYYSDISSSVSIPMVVYNISLAGLMDSSLVRRLASIPGVRGLKFTSREHDDMCALKMELGKDFMIYSGCDEMATQGLLAGADGIIGSFYNMLPDTFLRIYELARKGDYTGAFEVQKTATTVIKYLVKWDFFPIMKALMTDAGIDAGYSRRPFHLPDAATMAEIRAFCADMKKKHPDIPMRYLGA